VAEEREAPGAEPANVPAEPEPPGSAAAPAASAEFEALLRGDPRRELGGLKALQRSAGNQAVIGLLRAVAPPDLGRPTRPGLAREPAPVAQGASSPLVDRGAAPAPGQMPVDEFLALVERRVKAIAERELAATIYRVAGCPWIDHWLAHYRGRPVAEVERAIRRYAPATASARTVDDYLDGIAERVTEGIRGWQATGQLPAAATAGGEAAAPGAVAGARAAAASPPVPAAAPGAAVARAPAGRPLEPAAQARMGSAFGADFAGVRVHTEAEGQAVAGREGARAVTAGSDIAFAAGRYAPGTPAGDALLAHELAHVLQQTGGPAVARLEDPLLEADADLAALDAVVDLHLPGGARRGAAARREGPGV
jgi:hypothetical protein